MAKQLKFKIKKPLNSITSRSEATRLLARARKPEASADRMNLQGIPF